MRTWDNPYNREDTAREADLREARREKNQQEFGRFVEPTMEAIEHLKAAATCKVCYDRGYVSTWTNGRHTSRFCTCVVGERERWLWADVLASVRKEGR